MQGVPRSYYTQRNDLIWSTIEILHELLNSTDNKNTVPLGVQIVPTMMKATIKTTARVMASAESRMTFSSGIM